MADLPYTVADLVAEFIAACGVNTVFGVGSVHNLPMLDGIGRRNAVRFVAARGEAGAAHMADAYARTTGELGVCITSTGAGAANAVGGLLEAITAGTPLLHLTGHTNSKYADRHMGTVHEPQDQLGMLRGVCKTAYRVRSPHHALGILARAATDAFTIPTGPVSVEIPIDVQRMPIARPATLDVLELKPAQPQGPSTAELDALVERVARAKRPVIWLGSGGQGTRASMQKLLGMGFGMVSSWKGRGVIPDDHPMNLSGIQGNGIKSVQEFYKTVDLMLVVGARTRIHELGEFGMELPENIVQIDADPIADGRTLASELFVCADAAQTLAGLAEGLKGNFAVDPQFPDAFKALKKAAWGEFLDTLGVYGGFMDQLRKALPRDVLFARDITQATSTWGNRMFTLHETAGNVYPVGAGIGQGLPLAIGAAAAGRKTVLLTGDGGFMLNIGELWTALQEKLDLTIVLMNDGGYGVIKKLQNTLHGGRNYFADFLNPDFEDLARLTGMAYFKCSSADSFGDTVAEAVKQPGQKLVEVDMSSIGEFGNYFPFKAAPGK
jgi:acetolactate synthase-1/2/3 large subunit